MFHFQTEVFSILVVSIIILILIGVVNKSLNNVDPLEKPKGIVGLAIIFVQFIEGMTKSNMGDKRVYKQFAPYIGLLVIYLFISNILGLFAITPPTSNLSVTLSLTLITWIMVQRTAIKANTFVGFIKGMFEPIAPFVVLNFFGLIAPLISMSLRLFGNVLSGSVITELFYTFAAWISSFIPFIGWFNWFGVIVAPALHAYFDLFSGFIQMFIFVSLTTVYIGNELPEEEK